jgi:hypothetical protein
MITQALDDITVETFVLVVKLPRGSGTRLGRPEFGKSSDKDTYGQEDHTHTRSIIVV